VYAEISESDKEKRTLGDTRVDGRTGLKLSLKE
jgi:hypothetical protein